MATIDWPTARWARPAGWRWGVQSQGAAWSAAFSGQAQRLTHLADRLRVAVTLPACNAADAAQREAFFARLARSGDWVRVGHVMRPVPFGTLRGSPTAGAAAARGATTLTVATTAGATLLGGDLLGDGQQLLQAAAGTHTANGSGVLTLPLVLPVRRAIGNGAALTWAAPATTFQLVGDPEGGEWVAREVCGELQLTLLEVF